MRVAIIIIIYIFISISGLSLVKQNINNIISVGFVSGFALYGLGFIMWFYILSKLPLTIAFPIAAGGLIIGTQISGLLFLGESISLRQIFGIALILAGLILVYFQRGGHV